MSAKGAQVDLRQAAPVASILGNAVGIRIKRGTKSRRLRRSRHNIHLNMHDAANLPDKKREGDADSR
jgi:hypothetical protein